MTDVHENAAIIEPLIDQQRDRKAGARKMHGEINDVTYGSFSGLQRSNIEGRQHEISNQESQQVLQDRKMGSMSISSASDMLSISVSSASDMGTSSSSLIAPSIRTYSHSQNESFDSRDDWASMETQNFAKDDLTYSASAKKIPRKPKSNVKHTKSPGSWDSYENDKGCVDSRNIIEDKELSSPKIEPSRPRLETGRVSSDKRSKKRDKQRKARTLRSLYKELEVEREAIMKEVKAEMEAERRQQARGCFSQWYERMTKTTTKKANAVCMGLSNFLASAETFFSNLPLTIGAVGLAWVTMGVVWFKFMEENLDSCIPIPYNSLECTFTEFPGCFDCDTSLFVYRAGLSFHYTCHVVAGTMCLFFLLKLLLARQVVIDELSNPATSTPCGVICITIICVAAGRGKIGEIIVLCTSFFHFLLALWFFRMSLFKYHLKPDPSWGPNTVGIVYAAIKTWLYYPLAGQILLMLGVTFFIGTFFISLIRVTFNRKISAPVCWIQIAAPSIALYALTITGQPSYRETLLMEDSSEELTRFQEIHREWYMPMQHVMFSLTLVAVVSSVHALWVRWDVISKKEFSPAHVAFCFPTLSHTNAVQAYRGAINSFSTIPRGSPFKIALDSYWVVLLLGGTALNIIFTVKYFAYLPKWTKVDVTDEEEPPMPSETIVQSALYVEETISQSFVSPALLQANETGRLVRVRRGSEDYRGSFVRTRRISSVGFDPVMDPKELNREREALLEWVSTNPPRRRQRTVSVPHVNIPYGSMDTVCEGTPSKEDPKHKRSATGAW
eukprot:CAMPEP_0198283698 /NCGR_PEP_ID=MMETSP1449-20131203/3266_1 /TAXON_ID=420275 /ORGANISM="Attheya septentrionalis, Strain CCMP2084" /LENGTH=783 /DNA_ID=CAMNT_0043980431 /DNA_START=152 /DNA_END=2503 /DNA_ORIENTATION=-